MLNWLFIEGIEKNKTHFHKKGCALGLILKLSGFGTVKPGADPGFFLGGGALVSCSTSTPINHILFSQNTSCIRKPQVISDPPLETNYTSLAYAKSLFSILLTILIIVFRVLPVLPRLQRTLKLIHLCSYSNNERPSPSVKHLCTWRIHITLFQAFR